MGLSPRRDSRKTAAIRNTLSVLVAFALSYIAFCLYLYLRQESMLFHPQGISDTRLAEIKKHFPGSLFYLKMKDGTVLQGFDLNKGHNRPLVFYFGGNSVEASRILPILTRLTDFHVIMTNYRGFGKSGGSPSEISMYSDALEVFDHFCATYPHRPKEVFLIGRSLGSAVATWVASRRKVTAVVLITPFDSVEMLARHAYPWVPVSWLLKYKFDVVDIAKNVDTPLLVLLADHDSTVPKADSMNLIRSWKGTVRTETLPGTEHGTIMDYPGITAKIRDFFNNWAHINRHRQTAN